MEFADRGTADVYNGVDSKQARNTLPRDLWHVAQRKLDMLAAATNLGDVVVPRGNNLEKLKGELAGFHSIRINEKYRIVFTWEDGRGAADVRIVDYH